MSDASSASPGQGNAERREAAPLGAAERIDALDILRGFALFGVLLVNLEFWFRTSPYRYQLSPLAVAIFTAQIGVSRLWLKWFQHGPVEWLWRSLTYGRRQPMQRSA